MSRRRFLAGTAVAAGALAAARVRPVAGAQPTVDLGGVAVVPRSAWGGDLRPTGPLAPETDVRFLLVHHSVDPGNDYAPGDVPGVLRGFVRFHTAGKGWPDLAYNFLVDRFGRVWEGRTGSLAGPVAGDATGGNQGFDQLCCFVGDHQAGPPSAEAFAAMARLLGALARRYGVDLAPGATTTFTSRGSNRHPAGAVVTTSTVAGHRDMSRTQCPGDLVAARLPELRALAAGAAGASPAPPTTTAPATSAPPATTAPPTTSAAPTTTTSAAPTTTAPATTVTLAPTAPAPASPGRAARAAAPPRRGGGDDTGGVAAVAGVASAAAGVAAAGAWARRRRGERPGDPG